AHLISTQQHADGSFAVFPARPPIESSAFTSTALSLRSLQLYGKDTASQIDRARAWLEHAAPRTTEDRAMQLLGLNWAKADAARLGEAADALIAQQRPDGGWSQLTTLETDAYATGQALVALQAAGIATSSPAYQRGIVYLLR